MASYTGQLFGNYRLLNLLGEGGFAEVYLGKHVHLGTPAAIKVLTTKLGEDEIEQFRNEARIMIGMAHPHIMRVFDFGLNGRIPFIVMDYAPNSSLRKKHPKGSQLSISTVVNYVKQIAAALQYVHNQKLIHRDIKPENMLLGQHDEILLSDFGIAAVAHSTRSLNTQEGSGTIYYMPPEQIQGKPRAASDQYALAVVVYEWLSGVRPFNGTYWEIASQHLSAIPPSLHGKVSTISPRVERVVMKALEKDPKQRFSSIEEFALALEQADQKPALGTLLCIHNGHAFSQRKRLHPEWDTEEFRISAYGIPVYAYKRACQIWDVAWSPDGARIASSSNSIHVWNAATGNHIVSYGDDNQLKLVKSAKWSPNGIYIASGLEGRVEVWDVTRGNVVTTYQDRFPDPSENSHDGILFTTMEHPISWSPDGKRIASACDTTIVQIWKTATGGMLSSYACGPYDSSSRMYVGDWISAIQWSPDGRYIASAAGLKVFVWEVATGKTISIYPTTSTHSFAWSPDNTYIASSHGKEIHVWNIGTGKPILTYQGGSIEANDICWSPDGKYIASAHGNSVHIWNPALGTHIYTYQGHTGSVNVVTWAPDGTRVASGSSDGAVDVWQAA